MGGATSTTTGSKGAVVGGGGPKSLGVVTTVGTLNMVRGRPGKLAPPVDSMEGRWSRSEEAAVLERTRFSAISSLGTVRRRLEALLDQTEADEIIATAQIYDHAARWRSFEIAALALQSLVRPDRLTAARNRAGVGR
jgi:hypothetical protein